jgi:DNA repair exonuclease SbcCD ATPase subunit
VFSASHTPFLELKKADQSSMFERLVGLTMLSDKAESLKSVIKETDIALQFKKAKIDQLEKEQIRHQIQIDHAFDRIGKWVISNKSEIDDLTAQLSKLTGIDLDEQQTLHEELTLINSQLTQEVNLYEKIENKILGFNRLVVKDVKELNHLNDNKCPYCLQQFADTDAKIDELEEHIIEVNDNITTSTQELDRLDNLIEELEIARDKAVKLLTTPNIRDLIKIKNQSDNMISKIDMLKVAINPHNDSYQELINTKLETINYDDINELSTEIEHQKFLLKLLTKKDSFVRRDLLNNYIPYLNTRLQHYLSELGLPHKVEFTHEMTAKISQFGRPLDFGNLSAGQKARVNLSLSVAFSDVLQKLHGTVNVCFLDEVLDIGLDAVGIKAAAKLLKAKAKEDEVSMYIISHRDEVENMFDHALVIQMSKGFSYIKDNEVA